MKRRSLAFKLLLSYVLVVAIAAAAAFGTARWLGPRLFDHEVQQIGQRAGWTDGTTPGAGPGGRDQGSGPGADQGAGQIDGAGTTAPGADQGAGPGGTGGAGSDRGRGPGGTTGGSGATSETAATTVTTIAGPPTTSPAAGAAAQQAAIDQELADAFTGSLTAAMLVALAVGLVAGLLAAALVSRRLLRPLERMRAAVRRMAAGDHSERVPVPPDRELADLAIDVNALGAALADTEERRARFASDLAHELRTPITSLDGFLEGLEDGVFEPDAETLDAMRAETRRLERLAADLSALSRSAEEAFDLELQRVDLADIAATSARALTGAAATAGLTIEFDDFADPLPVDADPVRIGQVLTNLIRNAIQHTPAGGTVRVVGAVEADRAVVRVVDTGAGIPAADLERVFDRFVRLDGGDGSGGAGIGLTIARGIAQAHRADLTAHNLEGGGAEFRLAMPLARSSAPAAQRGRL